MRGLSKQFATHTDVTYLKTHDCVSYPGRAGLRALPVRVRGSSAHCPCCNASHGVKTTPVTLVTIRSTRVRQRPENPHYRQGFPGLGFHESVIQPWVNPFRANLAHKLVFFPASNERIQQVDLSMRSQIRRNLDGRSEMLSFVGTR